MFENYDDPASDGAQRAADGAASAMRAECLGSPPCRSNRSEERVAVAPRDATAEKPAKSERSAESLDDELRGLELAFPWGRESFIPHAKDGVLTKSELEKGMPLNEPYAKQCREVLARFDEIAVGGVITAELATKRMALLKQKLDASPEEQERKREIAELPQREEKLAQDALNFSRTNGKDPVATISESIAKNDVVFIASPALSLVETLLPALKDKSQVNLALADMPSSLAPLFEKGVDLTKGATIAGPYAAEARQYFDQVLETQQNFPNLIRSIQNAGIRIVPIGDDEKILKGTDQSVPAGTRSERAAESDTKERLLSLWKQGEKHVLVIGGQTHGALHYDGETPVVPILTLNGGGAGGGTPSKPVEAPGAGQQQDMPIGTIKPFQTMLYQLTHDPEFRKSGKVESFVTAAPGDAEFLARLDWRRLANDTDTMVAVPTRKDGKPTPVGELYQMSEPYTAANYDYLIVHPGKKK